MFGENNIGITKVMSIARRTRNGIGAHFRSKEKAFQDRVVAVCANQVFVGLLIGNSDRKFLSSGEGLTCPRQASRNMERTRFKDNSSSKHIYLIFIFIYYESHRKFLDSN